MSTRFEGRRVSQAPALCFQVGVGKPLEKTRGGETIVLFVGGLFSAPFCPHALSSVIGFCGSVLEPIRGESGSGETNISGRQ
ncbi:hypothetical protein SKAU_G00171640 [Synaphobranchus kaupii]|uniref:Uncharacterized protein n=1 Tax=Synaphobranchus kaupii TaxID=118154 RepID=A0A9Q1FL05_SYNKA|nr:hypothetical protein SKAU_G00171640 [Synaphobranchus kaupii]